MVCSSLGSIPSSHQDLLVTKVSRVQASLLAPGCGLSRMLYILVTFLIAATEQLTEAAKGKKDLFGLMVKEGMPSITVGRCGDRSIR